MRRIDTAFTAITPNSLEGLRSDPAGGTRQGADINSLPSYRYNERLAEAETALLVDHLELPDLTLSFSRNGNFRIGTPERHIKLGEVRPHPSAPYLIVDDGCTNNHYWQYTHRADTLILRIPLFVRLSDEETHLIGTQRKQTVRSFAFGDWVVPFAFCA